MEKSKKQSLVERYGKINIIIATLCAIFLIINSVIVSELALSQLASNKYLAYIINFLAGCEGKIGTIGSMSNAKVFGDGEWWRLFLHMYLHAGVLHMLFNIFALLFTGKVVEKKIGIEQNRCATALAGHRAAILFTFSLNFPILYKY